MTAELNGFALGRRTLAPGMQRVTFPAGFRFWRIGHNQLRLDFAHAVSERQLAAGPGEEARAARVGRIAVRGKHGG